jgi:ribosomal protein S1
VQGNKIQLTLKPVLLASDIPPLCKYEDAKPGMQYEGVVTLVTETGLLLTFYGDVKGWLKLHKAAGEKKYYIGEVVSLLSVF